MALGAQGPHLPRKKAACRDSSCSGPALTGRPVSAAWTVPAGEVGTANRRGAERSEASGMRNSSEESRVASPALQQAPGSAFWSGPPAGQCRPSLHDSLYVKRSLLRGLRSYAFSFNVRVPGCGDCQHAEI